jgi:two-component system KDP operon response regulator KdpE
MSRPGADPTPTPEGQPATVLVVDDEPPMLRFLRPALASVGYRVLEAGTGEDALREVATRSPDVVVLDLGLPDLDGIEVTRRLREWSRVPVIVLSARGRERDKIDALDAGADDYVTKPFAMGELLARIRAALRRSSAGPEGEPSGVLTAGAVTIDLGRRTVTRDGAPVRLTPTEFRLLATLARHAGRVLTHSQLLREVWGPGYVTQHHYLRVVMVQLRRKLEDEPSRPHLLLTEPGVGYRLRDDRG